MPKQTAEEVLEKLYASWAPHYYGMIQKCKIAYLRHNDQVIFFNSTVEVAQEGRMEAPEAKYWYRAMTVEEYAHLCKENQILQGHSYGGIATNAGYVKKYMGNNASNTHLIEFQPFEINVYKKFTSLRPKADMKAEGDGGTFGLGLTGQNSGKCGELFNEWLSEDKINWRLVYLVVPNPFWKG